MEHNPNELSNADPTSFFPGRTRKKIQNHRFGSLLQSRGLWAELNTFVRKIMLKDNIQIKKMSFLCDAFVLETNKEQIKMSRTQITGFL